MKTYTVEAIVLRRRPLGESDRILTLLSRERGKLSAVAKGVRRTQSKFGARLDFFNRAIITLHSGRSLDVVTGASSVGGAWERIVEPDAFAFASYVAAAVDDLCEPGMATPELFDVVCRTHDALAAGITPGAIAAAVDLHLLAALGIAPELAACARCGDQLGRRPLAGGRATLSPYAGGLICRRCAQDPAMLEVTRRPGERSITVSANELAALRALASSDLADLAGHLAFGSLATITHPFVRHHLGQRSRSLMAADRP
ncbi:MAG TPA: DNA repair protein RecO [Candidatus Eremiobacteraceae bacterium]|nr:DNA repair protein RecO [Candidatus Eremiobacteraceae bacterium]